jgi:hypothetical protein
VTRWVTRSVILGVAVTIALAGAAPAATAATAAARVGASPAGSSPAVAGVRAQRPVGDLVAAMLNLAGVRTCLDWRQGVTSSLRTCQASPSNLVVTSELAYGTDDAASTTSGGGNLAADRPTVASSALLGSPAAHAVDGSLDTAWRTRGDDQWWAVDLGRTTSLATVVLNWDGGELPSGYSLLTSTDGTEWKRVGKVRGRPNGGPTVLDAAVRARFVRVSVDGPAESGVALRDVRAFAPVAPPPDKRASRDRRDDGQNARAGADAGTGVGTDPGAPLSELPDGSDVPIVATGPLPDTQATGFGPATDPVTTAAVLVIVLAGVTSLVVGAQTTKGKHRRKRRRLPAPLTPTSLPKAAPPRPKRRSKPAPLTPPSLPRAAPMTPPSLPTAPPVTPPGGPASTAAAAAPDTPSRPLKAVPTRRPPHTPRPPIEIRWPDWAKLEWVRPNRSKPGRPAKRTSKQQEHHANS